ncbi:hypothetical protein ACFVWF_23550 [Rhodococcus qingshengii]|uniref:hypothetical protein n=1 Tax=Rhodococcus qingshengii TaxID=334542 RepID=UPI0036DB7E9A
MSQRKSNVLGRQRNKPAVLTTADVGNVSATGVYSSPQVTKIIGVTARLADQRQMFRRPLRTQGGEGARHLVAH